MNAGNNATIHEAPVTIGEWTGTGYSLIDPEAGAGAYRIGGGENGGELSNPAGEAGKIFGLASLVVGWLAEGLVFLKTFALVLELIEFLSIMLSASANCPGGNASAAILALVSVLVIFAMLSAFAAGPGLSMLLIRIVLTGIQSQLTGFINNSTYTRCNHEG